MLEVVNGDYGDHTELLTNAAKDQKWRTVTKSKCVVNLLFFIKHIFIVVTNKDKEEDVIFPVVYNDGNNFSFHVPPSEFTRFRILLYRCGIQLWRDWVSKHFAYVLIINFRLFSLSQHMFRLGIIIWICVDIHPYTCISTLINFGCMCINA